MTAKDKERSLAGGLGIALLVIVFLLLRKHLAAPATVVSPAINVSPTFEYPNYSIGPGGVVAPSLTYSPVNPILNLQAAYPVLSGTTKASGHDDCSCGCSPSNGLYEATFTKALNDNINTYLQAIAGAETTYANAAYSVQPPGVAQYLANTSFATLVQPSNFAG